MKRAQDLRVNFISTNYQIAINSDGDYFRIGDKVHHEGAPENEIGIIEKFEIDNESEEVKVFTDKGHCHIDFIYHVKPVEIEAGYECSECGGVMETDKTYCSNDCFKASQL